jgi:hypothetical protein
MVLRNSIAYSVPAKQSSSVVVFNFPGRSGIITPMKAGFVLGNNLGSSCCGLHLDRSAGFGTHCKT